MKLRPPPELVTVMPLEEFRPLAVTVLVAVIDLDIFNEPKKEEEPVPETVTLPGDDMVTRATFALFTNCRDSEAAPKLLVDRMKNLC